MPSILIVDDNAAVLQALEFFFQSEGFTVLQAADGRAGLRLAMENPVDIVLLDIEMPLMSGMDVCKAIKDNPDLRHLPVVMMTGRPIRDLVARSHAAGATRVLAKPFDLDNLRKMLAELLAPAGLSPMVVVPEVK
jgi:CheY-like chemotaxis protein